MSGASRKKSKRSGLALVLIVLLLASCGWLVLHYKAAFEATRSSGTPSYVETNAYSSLVDRTRGADAAAQTQSPRMQLYSVAAQQNETIALLRREIGDLLSARSSTTTSSSSSGQPQERAKIGQSTPVTSHEGASSFQPPPPPFPPPAAPAPAPALVKEKEEASDSQPDDKEGDVSSSSPFAAAVAAIRGNAMIDPSPSSSGAAMGLPRSSSTLSRSSGSTANQGGLGHGGGGGGGGGVFVPTRIAPNEWLIYLRIQKTGSQTFWSTLQKEFRADIWRGGGSSQCPERNFCGGKGNKGNTCEDVVYKDAKDILRQQGGGSRGREGSGGACKFLFRGHINVFDYREGLKAALVPLHTVKFITFLREPIARALSEYSHVTEGLVAQFGPETFGAAWDYSFYWNKTMPLLEKRARATLKAWLQCRKCRVGSSNRQARFLAGLATTGVLTPAEEVEQEKGDGAGEAEGGRPGASSSSSSPSSSSSSSPKSGNLLRADVQLLSAAVAVLKECAFVGLMERFEDSMLLLKLTFPMELKKFQSYMTSPHPVSEAQLEKKRKASAAAATIVPPRQHHQQQRQMKSAQVTTRRNLLADETLPVLRKAGSGWGHDKEEEEKVATSRVGGDRRDEAKSGDKEGKGGEEMHQEVIATDARAVAAESVTTAAFGAPEEEEEEAGGGGGEEENGSRRHDEDLELLVELNKADLGLYAVAERLFEARFAAATGFSSTDKHKAGERLGERFQFKKDVTLTRRKNRKFTAKLYELERAVYLGDRANDD